MDQVLSHLSIDFPHAQFLRVEAEELPEISKAYSVSDVPYFVFFKIAAYGKRFMLASQDTWELFQKHEMECIVDSDITTAICFLTGICSGAICIIIMAPWTWSVHSDFTATVSLLAFFIGYLMTRIAMALPQACVSCYYVCYAENPENRLFDKTIPERLHMIKEGRDFVVPTPHVPRRFTR